MTGPPKSSFPFRPWVRRAGASIVIVAALATAAIALTLTLSPSARYGWMHEPFVWVYLGVLWLGGLRVFLGTLRPVVEADEARIIIRPLHQLIIQKIPWETIRGTEQSGDRLIVYFETPRGMRFVALNLNLVKGRREFLTMLESRLSSARSAAGRVENPS